MRKKIVAGNWKMIDNREFALTLFRDIGNGWWNLQPDSMVNVWIAPPANYEWAALEFFLANGAPPIRVIAQNCSKFINGAHTGEISASSLKSDGILGVIVGHSERREGLGEDDGVIAEKVKRVLEQNMIVILCVGESAAQRDAGKHFDTVQEQVLSALQGRPVKELKNVVIAYEPVWAIGAKAKRAATSGEAQEMHAFIRSVIKAEFGKELADEMPILYGGSCKTSNAKELFAQPDIDGGLIGGASLNAKEFLAIANSF